jgi:hypothetical protein
MLSFIRNVVIIIALYMNDMYEALSFIRIMLYFSELKDIYETLSFIRNYADYVYVTRKMKHFV